MSRAPKFNPKKYNIQKVRANHARVVQLFVLGWKPVDIAKELNITGRCVNDILNSDIVKRQVSIMIGAENHKVITVNKRLEKLVPRAVDVYELILDGEINGQTVRPNLMKETAKDILQAKVEDFNPKHRVDVTQKHVFSIEDLDEIKRIAYENAKRTGNITNAEFTTVSEGEVESAESAEGSEEYGGSNGKSVPALSRS